MSDFYTSTPSRATARPAGRFAPEFELLLASARTVPDAARIEALVKAGINWRAFWEMAVGQGVRLLVLNALRAACWERIPIEARAQWQEEHQSITGKNLFLTGELLRIAQEFEAAETRVAVLKGAVIAEMAYGDFALREFSDIDLLVCEADFSRAIEVAGSLGYKPFWNHSDGKVLKFLRHMGEYKLTNDLWKTEIDLHWRVAHDSVALSPTTSDFPSGFQPVSIAGASVLSFAPQDLPLYLASQGGGDQWGDLRRICDVAEFLRRHPEVDWEPHLDTARRLGGERSMLTGLALAADLLGAELPESIANRIRADSAVSRLASTAIGNLQANVSAGESLSRYLFQMEAKTGWKGKSALVWSILTDRTAHDGSWIMLPRGLWWFYTVLRPLRICGKLLRRA